MRKEKPMLFSTPMVQAILAGRKTMTRHIIRPQPGGDYPKSWLGGYREWTDEIDYPHAAFYNTTNDRSLSIKCHYGQPGDLLWVRETWANTTNVNRMPDFPYGRPFTNPEYYDDEKTKMYVCTIYAADGPMEWCDEDGGLTERSYWKPSIHMPKAATRIWLEVVNVRVERLQDITKQDAIAEGISWYKDTTGIRYKDYLADASGYGHPDQDYPTVGVAVTSFRTLWDSINGTESWDANPWVWVVEFKKVEKPRA